MENLRTFSQIFFPDATVAKDSAYNFCIPDLNIDDFETFLRNTWGIYWQDA